MYAHDYFTHKCWKLKIGEHVTTKRDGWQHGIVTSKASDGEPRITCPQGEITWEEFLGDQNRFVLFDYGPDLESFEALQEATRRAVATYNDAIGDGKRWAIICKAGKYIENDIDGLLKQVDSERTKHRYGKRL